MNALLGFASSRSRSPHRWPLATVLLVALIVPLSAAEDQADAEARDKRIEELETKVEVLIEELADLRHGTGDEENTVEHLDTGLAPSAERIYRTASGFALGGYGEWLYQNYAARNDAGDPSGRTDTTDFLRLVLYTGYKFNDKILFNAEIEWEHATTGESGSASVEFAYLDFLLAPHLNVRAGMLLVPVGLVNELHEPPVFLSARRPDLETLILPTTWRETGAGIWGDLGSWEYRVYVVSSLDAAGFSSMNGIRGGRQKGSKARAEDWALTGRLDYRGKAGLLAGVSFFSGNTGQGREVAGSTFGGKVTTIDFHALYNWRALELRGVWARIDVDDAALISTLVGQPVGSRMGGYYLQAGWDLLASRSKRSQLIAFAKYESFDTLARLPGAPLEALPGGADRSSWTWGVTYKPHPSVALKFDYQDYSNDTSDAVDQFNVAMGFSF
ncbi:MAG TPA: hypothetical protein ENK10_00780 [Acidobacteria bacterium]|nr:hypothetical protein [Acidobacteriota bacterium]